MCIQCQKNGELFSERKGKPAVYNPHPAAAY